MVKQRKRLRFKDFLTPITIITSIILLIGLSLITLAIIFLGRDIKPQEIETPVVNKITAPTLTLQITTPTADFDQTPTPVFVLPEGVVGIGAYVQVIGTGGAGLRMRDEPGLGGTVNFTALDSEVFLVIDGPVEMDGYTWWHLEAPYDATRNGWSAGDYLNTLEKESD
jgi:hypothetical protein